MRIGLEKRPQAAQDFFHGLVEFRLVRVAFFQSGKEGVDGFNHGKVSANLLSLEDFEPDCNKRFTHWNSAKCRSYEIKWCIGYKFIRKYDVFLHQKGDVGARHCTTHGKAIASRLAPTKSVLCHCSR
ncbi:hypothetical protein EMIT0P12_100050 [Pseudomonas sp. IT-P12]